MQIRLYHYVLLYITLYTLYLTEYEYRCRYSLGALA